MRRPIWLFFTIVLLAALMFQTTGQERLYSIAPTQLPGTTRVMKTPGFWVSLHPTPDQVIMTPAEIQDFNNHLQNELKLIKDITQMPAEYPGEYLSSTLNDVWKELRAKRFFGANGLRTGSSFYERIKANMNLDAIPLSIPVRYGFTVHFVDERVFPTDEGLYEMRGDFAFDELQNSDLDVGTPVAVLHQSRDGQWLYVQSSESTGWVKAHFVAFCSLEQIKAWVSSPRFVIVTQAKADLYLDPEMRQYYDYVRMGARFFGGDELNSAVLALAVPRRNADGTLILVKGFIKKADVATGYLSYTPRTIIEQAFKLLNQPYGWGGMYGEQDCSRFLIEVFSTVGINLPRNSQDQAKAGEVVTQFEASTKDPERLAALQKALGGITILTLKGHIMLYLGMVEGKAYAIHAAWAYRERGFWGDRARAINRVAVTELSLGKGTQKKSWLDRLLSVNTITKYEPKPVADKINVQ